MEIDFYAQKIRTLIQLALGFFHDHASTHTMAAEGGCIVTLILYICYSKNQKDQCHLANMVRKR